MYLDAVPHVELGNQMTFYEPNPQNIIAAGKITGFVKFVDSTQQPKGAWQYYSIRAGNYDNENSIQKFELVDTLKLPYIAPKEYDTRELKVESNSETLLILSEENGSTYTINKLTGKVDVNDSGSGAVRLVTDSNEYQDYMYEFLKNN